MSDKPFRLRSSSVVYDLENSSEVYSVEWSQPEAYRVDGLVGVYGVILRAEEIATPASSHGDSILLESGDYILLESGTTDVLLKEAA